MSGDFVSPPPACPGLDSDLAGKQSACQGCPNQSICASGKAKENIDEDLYAIARRLIRVKRIILVLSGKGGVGKSTVATNIARALSRDRNCTVGLLDIDVCGPSIPMTTGLEGESIHMSASGWSPVYVQDNLSVISCGFLLDSDSAVVWRGPKKNGLIKQFLRDVDWGELDYLIVDTPPGTSDEHLSILSFLKNCESTSIGALIVTTPQEVALADVRKEFDFCSKMKLRVIGFVENMCGFVCPKCSKESNIFIRTDGLDKLSKANGIPILGQIPLDPRIAKACDEGQSCFELYPDAVAVTAFQNLVDALVKHLSEERADN